MRFFHVAVGLAVLGLVGCHDAVNLGARKEAIVGGVSSSRASVVALKNDLASGYCTATMIAPRVAVTAKHCVQRPGAGGPDEPSHYEVRVGSDAQAPDQTLPVRALYALPGVYTSQSTERDGTLYGVDVGLVVLEEASGLPTQPIRLEPLVNPLERTFITVGYGRTEDGENVRKREVELMASEVAVDRILAGPVVCLGDSGGPLIQKDDALLVAVTSYGIGACGSGSSAFNTFAGMGELFAQALAQTGSCLSDAQCPSDETCEHDKPASAVGQCQPQVVDAAIDASADTQTDAAHRDAANAPRAASSATGGACNIGSAPTHTLWWLLAIFALARRSPSLVASLQRL